MAQSYGVFHFLFAVTGGDCFRTNELQRITSQLLKSKNMAVASKRPRRTRRPPCAFLRWLKYENDAGVEAAAKPTAKIDLVVPQGSTLRIALDQRTRISHPGDAVHGKVVETVYAFDQPVIPAGSIATGHVIKVDSVTGSSANYGVRQRRPYPVSQI